MRRGALADLLTRDGTDDAEPSVGAGESLITEFGFMLPRGYVDATGTVHREGVMRLATARDELIPLRDDRVRENSAYLTVVLLARVINRIGTVTDIHAGVIENLFALPGLGAMLVTEVGNRDLIAVQSELFLLTAFFLLLGLAVDMAHHALDPRLKNASTDLQEVL